VTTVQENHMDQLIAAVLCSNLTAVVAKAEYD